MKKIFLLLVVLLNINRINAQKQIVNYYPVSTILKETGKLDKSGFPTGKWKYYSKNGTLDYEIDWEINYIKKYYATGELKEEGRFIPETGVHIGKWIVYDKNGKIKTQTVYDENGTE